MGDFPSVDPRMGEAVLAGCVIPAHPLALTDDGEFDLQHQRALSRYYAAAGAGGLAVAVHTTQFEIRQPQVGLFEPVLRCAAETLDEIERNGGPALVRVAGVCGLTDQAVTEAKLVRDLGYHIGLLGLAALAEADDDELIAHCREVARHIPLFGFYLQPAVGGRRLGFDFWRRFAEIPNVVGIKAAPFDRYMTLDVIRGVAAAGRAGEIALYTGNDDNIVPDLLTRFDLKADGQSVSQRFVGGLLGHYAVWTKKSVELFDRVRSVADDQPIPAEMLSLGAEVADMNAALFDAANGFAGCIAGVQSVLADQGLLGSARCLNPKEVLSPGQAEEIRRVRRDYPHLIDDDFVTANLSDWLS